MAKRVTVSIPDILHEKMEKWRESFNLSKMFQDAVSEAIQRKEEFQKRIREDLEMGEIIERLRKEKAHSERSYFDKGHEDGLLWARSAGYDDIVHALNWQDDETACRDRVLGAYFLEKFRKGGLMEEEGSCAGPFTAVYLDGWRKGLAEFWEAVKDKL